MLQSCLETFRSIVVLGWKLEDLRSSDKTPIWHEFCALGR
jgi:hypothetical protein